MSVALSPARHVAKRVAWAALAVFLLAFIVLEVINHGGPALAAALLLLIAPDLSMFVGAGDGTAGGGKLSPKAVPYYNLMHRPWIPLAVLVVYSFGVLGDWVPLFTAGLGWLTHIAVDRAFGYGLRERDGSRRV
ncbi:hypothetical protein SD37_18675 [Amycolatopsis orientalis]|uniref:DUF4260 domain-containing protein n=1 Tax=Amycolatopsis orientalis TaxID=31958 RepID=A0A193BZ75_AMYOR|nr:DUF4260 family protein [Amycolatopsis orientalis]ANN17473.1 hypothetical protein SD37_18675 [Amycolatopsis orientalis]